MIFKNYSRFTVISVLLFTVSHMQPTEKHWTATWKEKIKSSSWTLPTIIGSAVIGGLLAYNYVKKLFQKDEESLKHLIITNSIDILRNKEQAELKKLSNEQLNLRVENCIKIGDTHWKMQITSSMMSNLPEEIIKNIQKNNKHQTITLEVIKNYIEKNEKIFENIKLSPIAFEYSDRIHYKTLFDEANIEADINDSVKYEFRGGDFYLSQWGSLKAPTNNVEQYKIHLMPKLEDLFSTIKTIYSSERLNELSIDAKFRFRLPHNKTNGYTCPAEKKTNQKCFCANKGTYDIGPIIVIYTSKDNAQLLLNEVYNLFKYQEGLNVTPQFNRKITSLIYYAQGNSICKIFNPELYEQPDLVHYKPTIKSTQLNIINTKNGKEYREFKVQYQEPMHNKYHLLNPARVILPMHAALYVPTPLAIEEEK